MIELSLIRVSILIVSLIFCAYTDSKKGLIKDYVTLPMIALGVLLVIIDFGWSFKLLEYFSWFALLVALGLVMINIPKVNLFNLGDGDWKLIFGVYAVMPFLTSFYLFIVPVLIISIILIFLFSLFKIGASFYVIKNPNNKFMVSNAQTVIKFAPILFYASCIVLLFL